MAAKVGFACNMFVPCDGEFFFLDSTPRPAAGEFFRNRLRGGGGGDSRSSLRRNELQHKDTSELDRTTASSKLLYDGGWTENLITLVVALQGFYARQLSDPTSLVMLLHLLLSVVHFVTWASSYGGVNGSGPRAVSTEGFLIFLSKKNYCFYLSVLCLFIILMISPFPLAFPPGAGAGV